MKKTDCHEGHNISCAWCDSGYLLSAEDYNSSPTSVGHQGAIFKLFICSNCKQVSYILSALTAVQINSLQPGEHIMLEPGTLTV